MDDTTVSMLEKACRSRLDLKTAVLGEEYYYSSLTLCVIDAVYSIGVTYGSTRNTVDKYCRYFGMAKLRSDKSMIPTIENQESMSQLSEKFRKYGITGFTEDIFNNRQRTSTKNGILKSEAVYDFSQALRSFNVDYLQDVEKIISNKSFEKEIRSIPGQKSGISLKYFFMLAGSEELVKPDRMISRFVEESTGKKFSSADCQNILVETAGKLKETYPNITPRLLDHQIWSYQRAK
jgi:hypothetical protein